MFRRRRRDPDAIDPDAIDPGALDADDAALDDGDDRRAAEAGAAERGADGGGAQQAPTGRPQGPWDAEDAPHDELARLDLGGLQVPVADGIEVRVDMQEEQVIAATLVDGHSAMQIHAFAAPKSSGIWAEVREEIADSLRQAGGSAEETEGPFGVELRARIPADVPGAGRQLQPARFLGVDGPRWFLRGLLSGPAATNREQAQRLEQTFRGIVVVRGGEAMAPRDMLPLRLPREALQAVQGEHAEEEGTERFQMPERGPEITETR